MPPRATAVVQLNNMCQGHGKPTPVYETTSAGPAHQLQHTVRVFIEQVQWGVATHTSSKVAKEQAAAAALAEAQRLWGPY